LRWWMAQLELRDFLLFLLSCERFHASATSSSQWNFWCSPDSCTSESESKSKT
jgi:hypothetical protein